MDRHQGGEDTADKCTFVSRSSDDRIFSPIREADRERFASHVQSGGTSGGLLFIPKVEGGPPGAWRDAIRASCERTLALA